MSLEVDITAKQQHGLLTLVGMTEWEDSFLPYLDSIHAKLAEQLEDTRLSSTGDGQSATAILRGEIRRVKLLKRLASDVRLMAKGT